MANKKRRTIKKAAPIVEESKVKNFLKTLKLNEENISMILGALVIVVVGILIVNYFKDKKGETLPTAINTVAPVAKAEPGKSHTVTKGETLWSIAEDAYGSGYNWTDIYSANKLTKENVEAGQVLTIPQVAAKKPTLTNKVSTIAPVAPTAPATPANPATPVSPTSPATPLAPTASATAVAKATATPSVSAAPAATKGGTNATSYTVTKGDSLWKIAVAQYGDGYKWVEIARANKLKNPNVIHTGNQLTLPR